MNLNIVDLGADRVHAVGGWGDQDSILARDTKDSEDHIDNLVRSNAEEKVLWSRNVSELCDQVLEIVLVRVGVAVDVESRASNGSLGYRVEGRAVCVLVGIEQDAGGVVVAGTAVWLQGQDIGANNVLDRVVGESLVCECSSHCQLYMKFVGVTNE